MAVTETELNEALKRAATLMSPEGQRRIEHASRANSKHFNSEGDYTAPIPHTNMRSVQQPIRQTGNQHASGLPKVIQESLNSNPIENTLNEYSSEGSVLDSLGFKPSVIKENQYTQSVQYPQAPPQYTNHIDYNLIRNIVNECIEANMNRIKEELLKESCLKVVRLGGENKIQLIDNKNNLYESKLEFKRNLAKK